jgi:hypothetical protein
MGNEVNEVRRSRRESDRLHAPIFEVKMHGLSLSVSPFRVLNYKQGYWTLNLVGVYFKGICLSSLTANFLFLDTCAIPVFQSHFLIF